MEPLLIMRTESFDSPDAETFVSDVSHIQKQSRGLLRALLSSLSLVVLDMPLFQHTESTGQESKVQHPKIV